MFFGDQEADVEITDGEFDLICFSYPCKFHEGQTLDICINTLDAKNIMRSFDNNYHIERLSGPYDYKLIGKLINKSVGIVAIGKICIEIGSYIPNDIREGEFIEFECNRLDIN